MYKDLFPLGSVVRLSGGEEAIMIVGRVASKAGEEKVYDYTGVPYPEGIADTENMFFFDHEDIEEIDFIGCKNDLETEYRSGVLEKLDAVAPLVVRNGEIVPADIKG